MVLMKKHRAIYTIYVVVLLLSISSGYSQTQKMPDTYPDYSTPEATFFTHFAAMKLKDIEVMLDCLTDEYKQKYGSTRNEQLASFKKFTKNLKVKNGIQRYIDKKTVIEPDSLVQLRWSEKEGDKFRIRSYLVLRKVTDEWKIEFTETPYDEYPGFSTAENTLKTAFLALQNQEYVKYLESLTEENRLRCGKNLVEQLQYLEKNKPDIMPEKEAELVIHDVEYDVSHTIAEVSWSEKIDNMELREKTQSILIKIGEKWLISSAARIRGGLKKSKD